MFNCLSPFRLISFISSWHIVFQPCHVYNQMPVTCLTDRYSMISDQTQMSFSYVRYGLLGGHTSNHTRTSWLLQHFTDTSDPGHFSTKTHRHKCWNVQTVQNFTPKTVWHKDRSALVCGHLSTRLYNRMPVIQCTNDSLTGLISSIGPSSHGHCKNSNTHKLSRLTADLLPVSPISRSSTTFTVSAAAGCCC